MDSREWTDPEAQERDETIGKLLAKPLDSVHHYLTLRNVDPSDAWDIIQETFLFAFDHYHEHDPTKDLEAWLIGIAVNKLHDHRRTKRLLRGLPARDKKAKEPLTPENVERKWDVPSAPAPYQVIDRATDADDGQDTSGSGESSESASPLAEVRMKEARAKICRALGKLKPEYANVLILRHVMEYSEREVAAMLDKPHGTIKTLDRRGKAMMLKFLRREDVEDLL